jgi:hypothetical protein
MTNLFQILNQFVMLFRKNITDSEFFLWLKLTHVFQIHPVYEKRKNPDSQEVISLFKRKYSREQ